LPLHEHEIASQNLLVYSGLAQQATNNVFLSS